MLRGISPLISPALLKVLSEMGHGDEIVLGDANFPSENYGQRCLRADGISAPDLLDAILPLFPLDSYDKSNFVLMEAGSETSRPGIWDKFEAILKRYEPNGAASFMERFAYYERAKKAFAIVATGEKAIYANIILKKGVIR